MRNKKVMVSGVVSDSHSWNLIFMQLWLEEYGFEVQNLGNCVPVDEIVQSCIASRPALLVLSTVNGHGAIDGVEVIKALQAAGQLEGTRVVIGGKLSTAIAEQQELTHTLLAAGFDNVFAGPLALVNFSSYLQTSGLTISRAAHLAAA